MPEAISTAIEDFCSHLVAGGQGRLQVRDFYSYPLRSFLLPFCEQEKVETLAGLTPALVDRLAASLYQRKKRNGELLARQSVAAYLKALKYFLQWARERGDLETVGAITLPKKRRVHRSVLTPRELQRVEDAARTERDKLIIATLAATGMREGEAAALRVDDLIGREGRYFYLRVEDSRAGKTGARMPPIEAKLYRRLVSYRDGKAGRPKTSDRHLWIAERRRERSAGYEALTESGIYRAVRVAVEMSGIEKRVYPHLLRHTAITEMVAKGLHPAMISAIVGVSVAVIAEHYSHPSDEQTWEAMSKLWDR